MLMKVGVSDGTYDAWQDAVYDHRRPMRVNQPAYVGGLSKELQFQQILSQSATEDQPLGTIVG